MSPFHLKSKWFPLHVIPVLVVVVFHLAFVSSQLLVLSKGPCKDRCDESRPKGHQLSYKFKCTDAYSSYADIEKCHDSCEDCPKEVCDETLSNNPDDWNWVCPEVRITEDCRKTCKKYRPKGKRESYKLNCNDLPTDKEKEHCKNLCRVSNNCPKFVCLDDVILCPIEYLDDSGCKTVCDRAREYGDIGPISFTCRQKFTGSSPKEQQNLKLCLDVCDKIIGYGSCPPWVCDDGNTYTCPPLQIKHVCLDFCNKNRKASDGNDKFEIDCSTSGTTCQDGCDNCYFELRSSICDPTNTKNFICPPKDPEGPPHQAQTSYKGPCKSRCENGRDSSPHEYILDCGDTRRYWTAEEKAECENDCKSCPNGICHPSSKTSSMELHCRERLRDIEKEDKRKIEEQEEQKRLKREDEELKRKRDQEIKEKRQELKEWEARKEKTQAFILIGTIVGMPVLLGIFIGHFWYTNKRQVHNQVMMQVQMLNGPKQMTQSQINGGGGDGAASTSGSLTTTDQQSATSLPASEHPQAPEPQI